MFVRTPIKPLIRWIWARCEDATVIATQEAGVMATPTGPFKHTIKRVSPIFIFPLIKTTPGIARFFPPTLMAHADFIYPPSDIQLAIINQYTACLIFTVFTVNVIISFGIIDNWFGLKWRGKATAL